mgnify:CR=1 FL=1
MKRMILLLLLAVFAVTSSPAQEQRHFVMIQGNNRVNVDWTIDKSGDFLKYTIITGSRAEYFTMKKNFETIEYRVVDKTENTDAKVVRNGDVYTFSGKNKGKSINRTEKSSGLPWFQNVEFNGFSLVDGKKPVKFECIRYTEMDRHTMQLTNKGEAEVEGYRTIRVRASLTGALAGVWGCDYHYDVNTGQFVVYKGVEGGPGTPETVIKAVK